MPPRGYRNYKKRNVSKETGGKGGKLGGGMKDTSLRGASMRCKHQQKSNPRSILCLNGHEKEKNGNGRKRTYKGSTTSGRVEGT